MKHVVKQLGLTLLEVVIVVGIAATLGALMVGILVNNIGTLYQERSIVSEGVSLNDALQKINSQISQSTSVATSYPETLPLYNSDSSTLVLKQLSLSTSGNIISGIYDFVVIYKDTTRGNILHLQIFADPSSARSSGSEIITTVLEGISFTYLDKNNNLVLPQLASRVKVDLSVLYKTGSIGSKRSSSSVTTLRNLQ